jgi:hypothetical protein
LKIQIFRLNVRKNEPNQEKKDSMEVLDKVDCKKITGLDMPANPKWL